MIDGIEQYRHANFLLSAWVRKAALPAVIQGTHSKLMTHRVSSTIIFHSHFHCSHCSFFSLEYYFPLSLTKFSYFFKTHHK